MYFKKELDTTELIKWVAAVIGAVIAFVWLQYTELRIEVAKLKNEALQEIIKYTPKIRINYTNELSADKRTLLIRVYIVPKSKGDLYIFPPSLTLYQKDGSEISSDLFEALDLGQLQGSFPSNEKLNITYRVKLSEKLESKPDSLKLEYIVETANIDLYAISWYAKELDGLNVFGSTGISNSQVFESATRKRLIYQERLYEKGTNPIWNDFWSNPR